MVRSTATHGIGKAPNGADPYMGTPAKAQCKGGAPLPVRRPPKSAEHRGQVPLPPNRTPTVIGMKFALSGSENTL
jgi:hypothetical protein